MSASRSTKVSNLITAKVVSSCSWNRERTLRRRGHRELRTMIAAWLGPTDSAPTADADAREDFCQTHLCVWMSCAAAWPMRAREGACTAMMSLPPSAGASASPSTHANVNSVPRRPCAVHSTEWPPLDTQVRISRISWVCALHCVRCTILVIACIGVCQPKNNVCPCCISIKDVVHLGALPDTHWLQSGSGIMVKLKSSGSRLREFDKIMAMHLKAGHVSECTVTGYKSCMPP